MSQNLPPFSKQSIDSKILLQHHQQQHEKQQQQKIGGDRHQYYERNMINVNQTQTMNTIHERIQHNDHQGNYQNQHVQRNDDGRHYQNQHYDEARHDDNYQQQQHGIMITQHYQPNVNNEGKRKKRAKSSSRDGKIGSSSNEHVATGAPGNYSNHFINYQHDINNNNNNGNNGLLIDHSKITVIENQSQPAVFPMSDNTNNNIGNTLTFHTAVINKEKKKRKKKEVLEGYNHFKIMSNSSSIDINQQVDSNDETAHVERNSKKRKSGKQVQVSSFDLLSMTDNNAMFGVFKKKPSQQAYETVLHFNGGASSSAGDGQFKPPVASTNTTQNISQSESSQQPVITTPSPIHNPSSNSSSPSITNISQQVTFPNPIISNNSSIGFNTYSHNVNQSSSSGVLTKTPSKNESIQQSSGHITTLPQAIIGPSGSQPKRDFSNLNYGNITRSANFQSATDLLFSEKQNVKQDPTIGTVTNHLTKEIEPPTLSNNCNQQNFEPSSSIMPTTILQSSSNIVKNNANSSMMIASHSSPRTIIPSIKELFK